MSNTPVFDFLDETGEPLELQLRGAHSLWLDANGWHFSLDGCEHSEPGCLRCRVRWVRHLHRMGNSWRLSLRALTRAKR